MLSVPLPYIAQIWDKFRLGTHKKLGGTQHKSPTAFVPDLLREALSILSPGASPSILPPLSSFISSFILNVPRPLLAWKPWLWDSIIHLCVMFVLSGLSGSAVYISVGAVVCMEPHLYLVHSCMQAPVAALVRRYPAHPSYAPQPFIKRGHAQPSQHGRHATDWVPHLGHK